MHAHFFEHERNQTTFLFEKDDFGICLACDFSDLPVPDNDGPTCALPHRYVCARVATVVEAVVAELLDEGCSLKFPAQVHARIACEYAAEKAEVSRYLA